MRVSAKRISKAFVAGLWIGLCSPAAAQDQGARPSGPPPSWDSLIPCAQKSDPKEGFACYQAAMRAAGYAANPEIVAADKRRKFGLNVPTPFKHEPKPAAEKGAKAQASAGSASAAAPAPPEEEQNSVAVKLSQVALIPPQNRLLLVTEEGAIWEQTDSEMVSPRPKPGQSIQIEQNRFGGYFCRFDKLTKVRCTRTH
jgi:hypothetical protein